MNDLTTRLNQELSDRYRIRGEVGKGGMATVFLASDLRHERKVAIKVLLPALASMWGPERFLREIQIAANLRHPHILPLLDSGEIEGLPFYVMPYVEGESLSDRLAREKQLSIEETLKIGREVADALSYAHEKGVVHRDIKPANIMLESGHAIVADFGIALATEHFEAERLTASGVSPGSPQYMSPEQAAGEEDIDARSDIYSLGCVLFEALTGDPPFTGRLPQAILAKKLREPPPSPRVVRDSVPESIENIITKALSRSPADRFRTAADLGAALQAAAEGRDITGAPGPGALGRTTHPTRSHRSLAGVATGALVALVFLTTIGFLTNRVYDVRLRIPTEFTPSRGDWPIVGFQAMIPVLVLGFVALLAYGFLGAAGRMASTGLQRTPGLGKTYASMTSAASGVWWRVWNPLSPRTVSEVFFFVSAIAGILALFPFLDYLRALYTSETEVLSYAYQSLHERYTIVFASLIVALLLGWRAVYRYLGRKGPLRGRVAAGRWGSLGWIALLLVLVTLPWRLVYDSSHERALLGGERAYILLETENDLVIYLAEEGITTRHRKQDDLDLKRYGTLGYVFEGPEYFDGGIRVESRGAPQGSPDLRSQE